MAGKTPEELELERQMYIENLLAEGTATQDGVFHFNLESAKFFVLFFNTAKILNFPGMEWRNIDGEMITITIEEAQNYVIEIITTLKKVL